MEYTAEFEVSKIDSISPPSTPPRGNTSYLLPTIQGKHPDLASISPETLVALLQGSYGEAVERLTIVDCRFPYEFAGGHIRGALNIFRETDLEPAFREESRKKHEKHILVFHCEFSQQRGPDMLRHMRRIDRARNAHNYPRLDYPEVYLLDGGYEQFYDKFSKYCTPQGYVRMDDPNFVEELDMHFVHKKSLRKKPKDIQKSNGGKPRRMLNF